MDANDFVTDSEISEKAKLDDILEGGKRRIEWKFRKFYLPTTSCSRCIITSSFCVGKSFFV